MSGSIPNQMNQQHSGVSDSIAFLATRFAGLLACCRPDSNSLHSYWQARLIPWLPVTFHRQTLLLAIVSFWPLLCNTFLRCIMHAPARPPFRISVTGSPIAGWWGGLINRWLMPYWISANNGNGWHPDHHRPCRRTGVWTRPVGVSGFMHHGSRAARRAWLSSGRCNLVGEDCSPPLPLLVPSTFQPKRQLLAYCGLTVSAERARSAI